MIGSTNTQPANITANTTPLHRSKSNRRGVNCSAWKSNKLCCYRCLRIHSWILIKWYHRITVYRPAQSSETLRAFTMTISDNISGWCACLQQLFLYLCLLLKSRPILTTGREEMRNTTGIQLRCLLWLWPLCVFLCHIRQALEFLCRDFIGIQQLTDRPLRTSASCMRRPSLSLWLPCLISTKSEPLQ